MVTSQRSSDGESRRDLRSENSGLIQQSTECTRAHESAEGCCTPNARTHVAAATQAYYIRTFVIRVALFYTIFNYEKYLLPFPQKY